MCHQGNIFNRFYLCNDIDCHTAWIIVKFGKLFKVVFVIIDDVFTIFLYITAWKVSHEQSTVQYEIVQFVVNFF